MKSEASEGLNKHFRSDDHQEDVFWNELVLKIEAGLKQLLLGLKPV